MILFITSRIAKIFSHKDADSQRHIDHLAKGIMGSINNLSKPNTKIDRFYEVFKAHHIAVVDISDFQAPLLLCYTSAQGCLSYHKTRPLFVVK